MKVHSNPRLRKLVTHSRKTEKISKGRENSMIPSYKRRERGFKSSMNQGPHEWMYLDLLDSR